MSSRNVLQFAHLSKELFGMAKTSMFTYLILMTMQNFRIKWQKFLMKMASRYVRIANEILMYFRSQKKLSAEVSINETIDMDKDGNPLTYVDIISTDDTIAEDIDIKCRSERARAIIDRYLDRREREIIVLRYGLAGGRAITQRETAEKLGISRSYVSRIEKAALEKIAKYLSHAPI